MNGAELSMQAPVRTHVGAVSGGGGTRMTMDVAILPIYSFDEDSGGVTVEVRSVGTACTLWSSV